MDKQTDTMCPLSVSQTEALFGEEFVYTDEVRRAYRAGFSKPFKEVPFGSSRQTF